MRSVTLGTLVLASCAVLVARDAAAQRTAAPATSSSARRLSITLGLSKGSGALTCGFCSGERKGGFAGMLGVETRVRPAIRVGLEADWWVHSGGGSTRTVLAAIPVAHFHTSPSSPLFFKLGLGIGRFSATSDEEELRTTALSAMIGMGYEFRVANRNAVIPYVSWVSGGRGSMRLNGAVVTPSGGLSLVQYGLAFSKR